MDIHNTDLILERAREEASAFAEPSVPLSVVRKILEEQAAAYQGMFGDRVSAFSSLSPKETSVVELEKIIRELKGS